MWDSSWSFLLQLLPDAMINENSCQTIMHASCMYVHSRDMWDWNAKKAVWPKPDCPDKFRCPCHVIEKEILVHPTLTYTSPQWTGSSTKIRGKLLIEDQGSGNGGNIRPSQTWWGLALKLLVLSLDILPSDHLWELHIDSPKSFGQGSMLSVRCKY